MFTLDASFSLKYQWPSNEEDGAGICSHGTYIVAQGYEQRLYKEMNKHCIFWWGFT